MKIVVMILTITWTFSLTCLIRILWRVERNLLTFFFFSFSEGEQDKNQYCNYINNKKDRNWLKGTFEFLISACSSTPSQLKSSFPLFVHHIFLTSISLSAFKSWSHKMIFLSFPLPVSSIPFLIWQSVNTLPSWALICLLIWYTPVIM